MTECVNIRYAPKNMILSIFPGSCMNKPHDFWRTESFSEHHSGPGVSSNMPSAKADGTFSLFSYNKLDKTSVIWLWRIGKILEKLLFNFKQFSILRIHNSFLELNLVLHQSYSKTCEKILGWFDNKYRNVDTRDKVLLGFKKTDQDSQLTLCEVEQCLRHLCQGLGVPEISLDIPVLLLAHTRL